MKKISFKKLLASFSVVTVFAYGIIYACGGGDDWGWWSYSSNFAPETYIDKSYSPLFLSSDFFYSAEGYGHDNQHSSRFNDEIVNDWKTYLDSEINQETISFFITIDSSQIDLKNINKFLKTNNPNAYSNKWAKKMDYANPKVKNFLTFLTLAKEVDQVATNGSYWDYENTDSKPKTDKKITLALEKKYELEQDPFLKNRYWFQTIKSKFYSTDAYSIIDFFNKTQTTIPKNTLYYRALAYIAGLHYTEKNYALSNYQYSVVFDDCPTMRVVAAYCFHPQEQKDWNQSLKMAQNNDEKAALWAIRGYYNNELEAIENIYALNPKNKHIDYLLSRVINIQEQNISNDFEKNNFQQNKKATNDSIDTKIVQLVDKIAKENKIENPFLWNCAAGYLHSLKENYSKADDYYIKAEKKITNNELATDQLRLLRLINKLNKTNELNPKTEAQLTQDLYWLYVELPFKPRTLLRYDNCTNWSKKYISSIYKSQKNTILAELFNRDYNFYQNNENTQAMKQFLNNTNKTEFQMLAAKIYEIKLEDIAIFEAVNATFQNKIPDAITFMENAPEYNAIEFYGNPFNGNIKDCHDCDHQAYQKKKYTQLEFLKIVKTMQEKLALNENAYTNATLLGNAFYNITHHGNARIFYDIKIMNFNNYNAPNPNYNAITDCSIAKSYYQKALQYANNDEQRAKSAYLISKCERNEFYIQKFTDITDTWRNDETEVDFLAWNHFKILKNKYSKTKYYQEVLAECGYFNTFVNGPKY